MNGTKLSFAALALIFSIFPTSAWAALKPDVAAQSGQEAPAYKIVIIASDGKKASMATAINDAGDVAANGHREGYLFRDGKLIDLGSLGGPFVYPYGINSSGVVVGQASSPENVTRAFWWEDGKMREIGVGIAYAVNDSGIAVGYKYVGGGYRAALWDHGTEKVFGEPADGGSFAKSINQHGDMAGYSGKRACAWLDGKFVDLGIPFSYGLAINNQRQIAGSTQAGKGFVWQEGKTTYLDPLPGFTKAIVEDINERGEVVGYSFSETLSWHATLWVDGKPRDLNSLIPANTGWKLEKAHAINDSGQIVGEGKFAGETTAYLLTPSGHRAASVRATASIAEKQDQSSQSQSERKPTPAPEGISPKQPSKAVKSAISSGPILIGPNILVSGDGDLPHVEPMIAANPEAAGNLVGTAITFTRPDGGQNCHIYTSKDGGNTWISFRPPEGRSLEHVGDPQVAFGPQGRVYHVTLPGHAVQISRSDDGGVTWTAPKVIADKTDRPVLAVDHTSGKYAGNVYVAAQFRGVGKLLRSTDGGRTFSDPVPFVTKSNGMLLVLNMLVLRDGTLFIPYWDVTASDTFVTVVENGFVTSSDGGRTFSGRHKIFNQTVAPVMIHDRPSREYRQRFVLGEVSNYAVDEYKARDKIYVVWSDNHSGNSRVYISSSANQGKNWSEPQMVSPEAPNETSQFFPTVAVNRDGVVGVSWFDTRDSEKQDSYEVYFSASLDGGKSFLEPRIVSSAPSNIYGEGNLLPTPVFFRNAHDQVRMSLVFQNMLQRYPLGGDYLNMVADASGIFHPFWPDSRDGVFEMVTARVKVVDRAEGNASLPGLSSGQSVSKLLGVIMDPPRYDMAKRTAEIRVRFQNVSDQPIFGPLSATLEAMGWEVLSSDGVKPAGDGIHAALDLSRALGDFSALYPGDVSEAIDIHLRYPEGIPAHASSTDLIFEVKGRLVR